MSRLAFRLALVCWRLGQLAGRIGTRLEAAGDWLEDYAYPMRHGDWRPPPAIDNIEGPKSLGSPPSRKWWLSWQLPDDRYVLPMVVSDDVPAAVVDAWAAEVLPEVLSKVREKLDAGASPQEASAGVGMAAVAQLMERAGAVRHDFDSYSAWKLRGHDGDRP